MKTTKHACALAVFLLSPQIVPAAPFSWTNLAGGNWTTAANWSPNQVPTAADDAFITNSGTYVVTVATANANSLILGTGPGTQTLNLSGGTLTVTNPISVRPNGVLSCQNGTTIRAACSIESGGTAIASGTVTFEGPFIQNAGTFINNASLRLHLSNAGFTNLAGGTLYLTNSIGTFTFIDESVTNQVVANFGHMISAQNHTLEFPMLLGGVVEIQSGELGFGSAGANKPTNTVAGNITVATGATLALPGGGTFNLLADASLTGAGSLRCNDSESTANISGNYALTGPLRLEQGGIINFSTGVPKVFDTVLITSGTIGGTDPITITNQLDISQNAIWSGSASVELTASTLTTLGTSGTLTVGCPAFLNAGMILESGGIDLNADGVRFTNLVTGTIMVTNRPGSSHVFLSGGGNGNRVFVNQGLVRIVDTNLLVRLEAAFLNEGVLRCETNVLQFNPNSAPLIPLVQTAGAIELAGGDIRGITSTRHLVLEGGYFNGTGEMREGNVTNVAGVVSPGTSAGALRITKKYAQLEEGALHIELGGTQPGIDFAQLQVGANARLDGTLEVRLGSGFTPAVGSKFLVLTNATRTGQFANFIYPFSQVTLQLNYLAQGVEVEVLSFAGAGAKIWNGSVNGNWSVGANWDGGVAPVDGDDLVFPEGVTQLATTNNLSPNPIINSVTLHGVNYTLSGNALRLVNGLVSDHANAANAVDADIALLGSQTFSVPEQPASLLLRGVNLNLGAHTLTFEGFGPTVISNSISGSGGLVKNHLGEITLTGATANTFSGSTVIHAGILNLSKSSSNAISGPLILGESLGGGDADRVQLFGANQIADGSAVTVNASGLLDCSTLGPGDNETIQSLTLNDGGHVAGPNASTLLINGGLTCTGDSLSRIEGGGYLQLNATNPTINVTGDSATRTLLIQIPTALNSLTKTGPGWMQMAGFMSGSPDLDVKAGTFEAGSDSAFGVPGNSVTVASGATLYLSGGNIAGHSLTLNGTGVGGTTGALKVFAPGNSLVWSGPITLASDSTIDVSGSGAQLTLSNVVNGAGKMIKAGVAVLRLAGDNANTYSGGTTIRDGYIDLAKTAGVTAVPGDVLVGTGLNGASPDLHLSSADQIADGFTVTVDSGIFDLNGFSEKIGTLHGSGSITLGPGPVRLSVEPEGVSCVFNGDISDSGNGGLTKNGTGTLILTGNNAYHGGTIISDGTLVVNGSQPNSTVTMGSAGRLSGTGIVGQLEPKFGTIAPGTSPGILTCSNLAFIFTQSVTNEFELNGLTPGTGYDQLRVRGTVSLNDAMLKASLNFQASPGDEFIIIDNDGVDAVTGTFNNLPESAALIIGDGLFRISYTGGDGNDVVLTRSGPVVNGVTRVWSGTGADSFWLNPANWLGNVAPDQGDNLEFPAGAARANNTNNFPQGSVFNRLTISSNSYALNGNALLLNNGVHCPASNGSVEVAIPLALTESQSFTNNAGTLIFSAPIDLGAFNLALQNGSSSGGISFEPAASMSGAGGFEVFGNGTVSMFADNTFAGEVSLNEGRVDVYNSAAFGRTNEGTTVVSGTLRLFDIGLADEPLTLAGPGNNFGGTLRLVSGNETISGDIMLASNATIEVSSPADSLNLTGAITGPGELTKIGIGTLRLSGKAANSYAGTTHVDDGVLELAKTPPAVAIPGNLEIGGTGTPNTDVVHLLAGNQIQDSALVSIAASGLLDLSGGFSDNVQSLEGLGNVLLGGNLGVGLTNGPATYGGTISGTGGLVKFGPGTLILAGTNPYTGFTLVAAGTLQVDGYQPTSALQVNAAARLQGSGTVGDVTGNGSGYFISPGSSPGKLTCGNYNAGGTGSGTLQIELNGTTAGVGYDQVNVQGGVNLANLALSASLNFPSASSNEFVIINNDGTEAITDTFTGKPEGSVFPIGGEQFQITYAGGDGNDVVLTQISGGFHPALSIEIISPTHVRLLWPTNDAAFRLQFNTNLAAAAWSNATPLPVVVGTNKVVTNAVNGTQNFYRLIKP